MVFNTVFRLEDLDWQFWVFVLTLACGFVVSQLVNRARANVGALSCMLPS